MASTGKVLAFALFDKGKRPSDPEVKGLGLKPKSRYNYFQEWKKLSETTPEEQKGSEGNPPGSKKVAVRASTAQITVGKITIVPEDWRFSQYGAILVLDTYNKAKRDINYGGTVADFLCDITEFYRRIVNYKEVDHGRAISEGGERAEENGRTSVEQSAQPVEA